MDLMNGHSGSKFGPRPGSPFLRPTNKFESRRFGAGHAYCDAASSGKTVVPPPAAAAPPPPAPAPPPPPPKPACSPCAGAGQPLPAQRQMGAAGAVQWFQARPTWQQVGLVSAAVGLPLLAIMIALGSSARKASEEAAEDDDADD